MGDQKEALCWPWTNPAQKLWILFASLAVTYFSPVEWRAMERIHALPPAVKVLFAIEWTHFAPWHLAMLTIAVCACRRGLLRLLKDYCENVSGRCFSYREAQSAKKSTHQ